MKRYNEMETEALAAVSEETLKTLIELEYAHNGVVPAERPTLTPLPKVEIFPSDEAFECDNIIFKNLADAETFKKLERFSANYDYNVSSDYKYLVPASDFYGIKPTKFYKKSDIDSARIVLSDIKRIEKENSAAESEYEKFCKETASIREEVYEAYRDACEIVKKREQAAKVYEKHLVLAEGNEEIAKKFFRDAYKNQPDIIHHILKEEPAKEEKSAA